MAHLIVPLLLGVGAHGAGKCVPGAPGPGREVGEPDAEPAGGHVGLGSQPTRHKGKLPNCSTTACWHGMAVVRGTTGVRPELLDCLRHAWFCHEGRVGLPEGVPRAGGGAPRRRECFPTQAAAGASCIGCGATVRVDEGAERAPHPNGLSVGLGGGDSAYTSWHLPFSHRCDAHCAVWCHDYPILKQMRSFAPRGHGREVAKPMAVPFPQVQGQIAGPQ